MKFSFNNIAALLLILIGIGYCNVAIAQTEEQGQSQETPKGKHRGGGRHKGDGKIEAARIGYLTSKLDLTESQAQDFWPIHNEFAKKRKEIFKQMKQLKRDNDVSNLTEEQAAASLKILFDLRETEVKLEREYSKRFLKVITNVQLVKYFQAENEFTRMLLKRLGRGENQTPSTEE